MLTVGVTVDISSTPKMVTPLLAAWATSLKHVRLDFTLFVVYTRAIVPTVLAGRPQPLPWLTVDPHPGCIGPNCLINIVRTAKQHVQLRWIHFNETYPFL